MRLIWKTIRVLKRRTLKMIRHENIEDVTAIARLIEPYMDDFAVS